MRVSFGALMFLSAACSSAAEHPNVQPDEASAVSSGGTAQDTLRASEPDAAPADPRRLAAGATFADLVGAATALDGNGGDRSSSGCLLARSGEGHVFRADVAVSLRPLPAPPTQLATDGASVRAFSRWGQRGTGALVLAAFTASPPPVGGPALALLLAEDGIRDSP